MTIHKDGVVKEKGSGNPTQRRGAAFGHNQIVLVLVLERPARPRTRTSSKILHKMLEFQG
jgi:hypothetical protein